VERLVVGVGNTVEPSVVEWVIQRAQQRPIAVTLVSSIDLLLSDPLEQETQLELTRRRILETAPHSVVETQLSMLSIPVALVRASVDADLLVLGSHHRRLVEGIPNLALQLAGESSCPTVIVPREWTPQSRHHRILVGLGEDRSSTDALEAAAREAECEDAALEVVHSWLLPNNEPQTPEGAIHAEHERHLREEIARLEDEHPGLRVSGLLQSGAAPQVLLHRATLADLIVVGSHRRGMFAAFVFGATGRMVANEASTPLLIVPPGSVTDFDRSLYKGTFDSEGVRPTGGS
jgi:nucleotide-binding universal stress UspA family protein